MPLLNSVTTPYAEALLQVVNENSQTEEMVSEVKQLLELINDSPELEKALSSPILETDAKKKIINEIFSKKVNSSLLNFLKLLADRQRIGILTSILNRFLEIYRENSNIALATVTSAVELTDEQKGLITQKIVNIAGTEKLELVTKIDPSLIGGFVASVGSKVIAHPECSQNLLILSDFIGSTSKLLDFVSKDPSKTYMVLTEPGIIHQMKKKEPNKIFIEVPDVEGCKCNECPYMKLNTLEKILDCLKNNSPSIELDPEIIRRARVPIKRMLDMSN